MRFYFVLIATFLSLFPVANVGLSLTYSDILMSFVILLYGHDIVKGKIKFEKFSTYWGLYLFILLISGAINLTLFEGRFLNVFKTNLFSLILFSIIYNLIKKKTLTAKKFILGLIGLLTVFLLKTWTEMQTSLGISGRDFTHLDLFESSLNLNGWGFCLCLFLFILLFAWNKKIYSNVCLAGSIILVIFIFFSFSRTAYSITALIVSWNFFYILKLKLKKILPLLTIISLIVIFSEYLNFFNFKVSDTALNFFTGKSENYGEDLINTRFYLINIEPIVSNFEKFNIFQVLFGDGESVQHSWISNSLVVTGMIGFIVYLKKYLYIIQSSYKKIKLNNNLIEAQSLILLTLMILINDFVTNISSFLPIAAYLSAIIFGFCVATLDKNNE